MDLTPIILLLLSFMPTIESRYTLPTAIALGYDPLISYIAANTVSILLALALSNGLWVFDRIVRNLPHISRLWTYYIDSARERVKSYLNKYGSLGLILFVAIPLPGTGIWTGSIAGYVLGIPPQKLAACTTIGGIIANTIAFLSVLGVYQLI